MVCTAEHIWFGTPGAKSAKRARCAKYSSVNGTVYMAQQIGTPGAKRAKCAKYSSVDGTPAAHGDPGAKRCQIML